MIRTCVNLLLVLSPAFAQSGNLKLSDGTLWRFECLVDGRGGTCVSKLEWAKKSAAASFWYSKNLAEAASLVTESKLFIKKAAADVSSIEFLNVPEPKLFQRPTDEWRTACGPSPGSTPLCDTRPAVIKLKDGTEVRDVWIRVNSMSGQGQGLIGARAGNEVFNFNNTGVKKICISNRDKQSSDSNDDCTK